MTVRVRVRKALSSPVASKGAADGRKGLAEKQVPAGAGRSASHRVPLPGKSVSPADGGISGSVEPSSGGAAAGVGSGRGSGAAPHPGPLPGKVVSPADGGISGSVEPSSGGVEATAIVVEEIAGFRDVPMAVLGFRMRLSGERRARFDAGWGRAVSEGWSRWIRSYQDVLAVADGCWFDADEAAGAIDFITTFCVFTKGKLAGQAFVPEVWQRDEILAPLFGWKRLDGTRRFRRAFIFLPKKNGKSTLAAAIALVLMCFDEEPGVEVYFAATKIEQARIVFKTAKSMVNKSPGLKADLRVRDHLNVIEYPALDGEMKVLAADGPGAEGLNIHGLIRDELHAWKDRTFYDSLFYGDVGREQPLAVDITTSGDWESEICQESYDEACAVRDGAVDDWGLLPVIYEAGKLADDDGWKDPAVWALANPALGSYLKYEDFESAVKRIEGKPRLIASFKRYRLNVWQDATEPWLDLSYWLACRCEGPLELVA